VAWCLSKKSVQTFVNTTDYLRSSGTRYQRRWQRRRPSRSPGEPTAKHAKRKTGRGGSTNGGSGGGGGGGGDKAGKSARKDVLRKVAEGAKKAGNSKVEKEASTAADAEDDTDELAELTRKPTAKKKVDQEYINAVHLLSTSFVVPVSTPAHASYATTGVKQIRQQESSYRQNRLRDIKANSNLSLCVLGKQNVRRRFWFVLCVHHLSRGPYHGPCHARSAGGGQAARTSDEKNIAVVEVDTAHWYSDGDKCPHEPA
jgi:hypothetical protein